MFTKSGDNLNFPTKPKNNYQRSIILMIGDGMGHEQIKLARWVEKGVNGSLSIDTLHMVGNVTTYSNDNAVTDSAAAGTALATGNKTNNGYLGINSSQGVLETILEYSQSILKSTGLVTTTEITHATPASFIAHVGDRHDYLEIKTQEMNSGIDVMLGGGASRFTSLDFSKMRSKGYTILNNVTDLIQVNASLDSKLFGAFSPNHLPYVQDRLASNPTLPQMTQKSLEVLNTNQNGFFLMVEGGRIDHSGHISNAVKNALETIEFDQTVQVAKDYVDKHPGTLLLVTGDHETGGLKVISQNLNTTIPDDLSNEADKLLLRTQRVADINLQWTSGGSHTAVKIPLYAYGPNITDLPLTSFSDNTDVFRLMKLYFPYPTPDFFNLPSTTTTMVTPSQSLESGNTSNSGQTSVPLNSNGFGFESILFLSLTIFIIVERRKKT